MASYTNSYESQRLMAELLTLQKTVKLKNSVLETPTLTN